MRDMAILLTLVGNIMIVVGFVGRWFDRGSAAERDR